MVRSQISLSDSLVNHTLWRREKDSILGNDSDVRGKKQMRTQQDSDRDAFSISFDENFTYV